MENDLEYWMEGLRKIHCVRGEKSLQLLNEIIFAIEKQNLSKDDIVSLLRNVDAEVVEDILNLLITKKVITEDELTYIDDELVKIYEQDYLNDLKSGAFKSRIELKTVKSPRPISTYELLGIYLKKSQNYKILFGNEKTEDEFLQGLADCFMELKTHRKANQVYKKQQEGMEQVLHNLLNEVESLKSDLT